MEIIGVNILGQFMEKLGNVILGLIIPSLTTLWVFSEKEIR
jgi:hypothetical protein